MYAAGSTTVTLIKKAQRGYVNEEDIREEIISEGYEGSMYHSKLEKGEDQYVELLAERGGRQRGNKE